MNNKCITRSGNGPTKIANNENLKQDGQHRWIETRLFFGLGNEFVGLREQIPANAPAANWDEFLRTEVEPAFSRGFTVLRGEGFWQNVENGETGRESSRILLLVHPNTAEFDEKLEALQSKWCARFNQESVLRVSVAVLARF